MKFLILKKSTTSCIIIFLSALFWNSSVIGQANTIPFEVEDHFEIQNDPDVGIKLMPENLCENSESSDFGFVFKRNRRLINSDAIEPPAGECGAKYFDAIVEFYPDNFSDYPYIQSSLGLPDNRWTNIYASSINTNTIRTVAGGSFSNSLTIPGGRNVLKEGDGLNDDAMIFHSAADSIQVVNEPDIGIWASDDVVINYRAASAQTDGVFKVTETTPTIVRFKVGTGGTVFMPALPSTTNFYPSVRINPVDGQLYYEEFTINNLTAENKSEFLEEINSLKKDNLELKEQLTQALSLFEAQANEISLLKTEVNKITEEK